MNHGISRRTLLLSGLAAAAGGSLAAGLLEADTRLVLIESFSTDGKSLGAAPVARVIKSDADWRALLSARSFAVTRKAATESPFSGKYDHYDAAGLYHCVCCGTALFDSRTKFDSGTGWPSFWRPISAYNVSERHDSSFGMRRTEVLCRRCEAHLGHVFKDGPPPTGLRYCMNSVALNFVAFADFKG